MGRRQKRMLKVQRWFFFGGEILLNEEISAAVGSTILVALLSHQHFN